MFFPLCPGEGGGGRGFTVLLAILEWGSLVVKFRATYNVWEETQLKVTVQFERCFRLMEHISVISWRNSINLSITEKLIKFSKSLFCFYLVIFQINKENKHLVFRPLFALSGVQVEHVVFDSINYYIFIFDTVTVQNCVSVFWKAALFVIYSQNPEIALS